MSGMFATIILLDHSVFEGWRTNEDAFFSMSRFANAENTSHHSEHVRPIYMPEEMAFSIANRIELM